MSNFQLPAYNWNPRRDQVPIWRRIMSPDFRKGVVVGHRRYGKDELGLQATAVKAMERVGSYWYALPEYAQARKMIWEMVNWRTKRTRIDDAFPPEIVARRDNQTMMLWLESGSTVQLIGSDQVDSLVGGGQVGIVMSEAALSNPKALQFFRPILEESGGWELQISTPRGKNHFHRAYTAALEDMRAGDPGVVAALMDATKTDVFPAHQMHRIKMDLIREHGRKMGEAIFEQEYMCSFTAAIIGAVWGDECQELENQGRVRPLPHDRRLPVVTSWDIGVGDPTSILFFQDTGARLRLIDAFESSDLGLDTYVSVLKEKHQKLGYIFGRHVGPHDIQQREWIRGVSRMDEAKRLGLIFKRMPQTRIKTQIAVGAQLIHMMEINSESPEALAAFEHFKAYHYPISNTTGDIVATPVHDEHSHASSALMTMALDQAARLGVNLAQMDPELSGNTDALGGGQKFDPRGFGNAPYGGEHSVSAMMRGTPNYGGKPRGGAFG